MNYTKSESKTKITGGAHHGVVVDELAADGAMQAAIVIRRAMVIVAFAAASCRPSEDPGGRSAAIVIAEGATGVHYTTIEDEENIAYEAPLPYPAAALIARIDGALRAAGYTRADDPQAFRWMDYEAADGKRVDHWNGTWRSSDGARTAEYILEYRGRRDLLHVWARAGAAKEQSPVSTTTATALAVVEAETPTNAIELAEREAAVLCGAEGSAVVTFQAVSGRVAEARWRFRSARGVTDDGRKRVEERPGAKPKDIDASDAHFTVGRWDLTWSPAAITIESDARTVDQAREGRVTSATHYLYYPSGVRLRKISAAEMPTLDLRTVCP